MNRIAIVVQFSTIKSILLVLFVGMSSTIHAQSNPTKPCAPSYTALDSTGQEIKDILEEFVSIGVPGIQLTVYKAGNWQMASAGYADREHRIPMGDCHLQYLQSIAKLYMATAILQLETMQKNSATSTSSHSFSLSNSTVWSLIHLIAQSAIVSLHVFCMEYCTVISMCI